MDVISITGNIGKSPEVRFTPTGGKAANFTVASNERRADGTERTKWFTIIVWDALAEACARWLHKGRLVTVVGSMRVDDKTGAPRVFTRQDGSTGTAFEVQAWRVEFHGPNVGPFPLLEKAADLNDTQPIKTLFQEIEIPGEVL